MRYDDNSTGRDLRIDMIRGLVMLEVLVVHFEFFSAYCFLFWERIGVVSGAEFFMILSGVVTGMVYKKSIMDAGLKITATKLVSRAILLWRVNVAVIVSIAILNLIPHVNASEVMTYVERGGNGDIYPLFPAAGASILTWLTQTSRLQIGPHQIQILGLYVCLLALSPFSLLLMKKKQTHLLLLASWALYGYNWIHPAKPTGAMFEDAFPLLTWQVVFFTGQAIGYHKNIVVNFFKSKGRIVVVPIAALFSGFVFWTFNAPNQLFPSYTKLSVIPPDFFMKVYSTLMNGRYLGILRILDDFCVIVMLYLLLTRFWTPIHKALGWLLIPIGQASLYVFVIHVYLLVIVSNIMVFGFSHLDGISFLRNTIIHTAVILSVWTMVRYKFMFRWIPR
jgi:hypothetical protein